MRRMFSTTLASSPSVTSFGAATGNMVGSIEAAVATAGLCIGIEDIPVTFDASDSELCEGCAAVSFEVLAAPCETAGFSDSDDKARFLAIGSVNDQRNR